VSLTAITEETLALLKSTQGDLTKAITTATGLTGYSLEAPAKQLYPVLTPLRNRIGRQRAAVGASAVNWKQINGINTGNVWASVGEGLRNSEISYSKTDRSAAYKTLSLDDSVTHEANAMGRGFDDVRARSTLSVLEALMMEEEKMILGGNVTAIAKPASVTGASATGGSLSNSTTYDWGVSALTLQGYLQGAVGRVGGVDAKGETDCRTGSTATAGGGTAIALSWPAVRGAVAYNVYAGTSGGTKYYIATVYTNGYTVLALTGTGGVINVADQTANALDFDGMFAQITPSAAGAYWLDRANAALTADNAGGVTEIDTMLANLWNTRRVGPTLMIMNAQERLNITKKIAGSTGLSYTVNLTDGRNDVAGGIHVSGYLNKYASSLTPGAPNVVPFLTHPYMPPGTILVLTERLPYPNSEIDSVFEMDVLSEYLELEYAKTSRKFEHGVEVMEVLKCYAPATCGVITGIANG
jgi:hypothetical protein